MRLLGGGVWRPYIAHIRLDSNRTSHDEGFSGYINAPKVIAWVRLSEALTKGVCIK
jgi:hypothetical protein